MKLVIGSRGSQLALAQSRMMEARLKEMVEGLETELIIIKTKGDQLQEASLTLDGGKGLFTKEIEDALLEKKIDLAVHSLKDLPVQLPAGLALGAVTTREDFRDAWVSRDGKTLDDLPPGAVVGTSSPRRAVQLRRIRSDLEIRPIRGNVDTRLRKVEEGEYDATLLASAGLRRLNLQDRAHALFEADQLLPAPGQGFLGIEIRAQDPEVAAAVAVLHDERAAQAASAERALLEGLQVGCQAPVAAWARHQDGKLVLTGLVAGMDRDDFLQETMEGPSDQGESLGSQMASAMLQAGAAEFLAEKG